MTDKCWEFSMSNTKKPKDMQEKTMFTFGNKEGIHNFTTNPHLVGSWVGNGNSHLSKLNGSLKRFWWPS